MRRTLGLLVLLALLLPAPGSAGSYDPRRAGHPLRIAAYALHPAGVILDWLIFRPAWALGSHEPLRTLFGVDVPPQDYEIPPPAPAPR
jgi:hypothetical protein